MTINIDTSFIDSWRTLLSDIDRQIQHVCLKEANVTIMNVRRKEPKWPRDTGLSGNNFIAEKFGFSGAQINNPIYYSEYVHEKGISELALKKIVLKEADDALGRIVDGISQVLVYNFT